MNKSVTLEYILNNAALSDDRKRKLEMIYSTFQFLYKDNFDMQIKTNEDNINYPEFIIKYPVIKITNSNNDSIIIYDLFVRVMFNRYFDITDVSGIRSTMTKKQLVAGYLHSHLSSKNLQTAMSWKDFCQGSNGLPEAIGMYNGNINAQTLTLFLLQLNAYVEWESLEGGPYIEMKDVHTNRKHTKTILYNAEKRELDTLLLSVTSTDIEYQINKGELLVKLNKAGIEKLSALASEPLLAKVDSQGEQYQLDSEVNIDNISTRISNLHWKNVDIKILNVINDDIDKTLFNVRLINLAVNYINNQLNKKLINFIIEK